MQRKEQQTILNKEILHCMKNTLAMVQAIASQTLRAAVGMMHEAAAMDRPSLVQGLLQRVEHEAGVCSPEYTPADDPPRMGVDDEGDIDKARPGRDVGKVREPEPVGRRRVEHPVDMVQRAGRSLVLDSRADRLAANDTLQAKVGHQALDRAAGNVAPLAQHLSPDLARAIDFEVLAEHALDLRLQLQVPLRPSRPLPRIDPLGDMLMVG